MGELPVYISILFGLTAIVSVIWFYLAAKSKTFLMIIIGWSIIQTILGISGFYQYTDAMPPRLMLFAVLPTLIFILFTFLTTSGKQFIEQINLKTLTYFHSVRLPVEIVLSLLFHNGVIPELLTFEGTNFDILSGISAPIVAYLSFRTAKENRMLLLIWNVICLLLLLNIIITSIFAFPFPFQQFAFDQPNIAMVYFPFNLLPAVVVPLVLFAHLAAIKRLMKK